MHSETYVRSSFVNTMNYRGDTYVQTALIRSLIPVLSKLFSELLSLQLPPR